MPAAGPRCIECDHAFELADDAATILCSAPFAPRPAGLPASCPHYAPRQLLTEANVTEIWSDGAAARP